MVIMRAVVMAPPPWCGSHGAPPLMVLLLWCLSIVCETLCGGMRAAMWPWWHEGCRLALCGGMRAAVWPCSARVMHVCKQLGPVCNYNTVSMSACIRNFQKTSRRLLKMSKLHSKCAVDQVVCRPLMGWSVPLAPPSPSCAYSYS